MEALASLPSALAAGLESHAAWLATPHRGDFAAARTLFWPWLVQFVMSWVGFSIYMVWDYRAWRRGTLEADKLPSRHPIHESPLADGEPFPPVLGCLRVSSAFWYSQLFMVPLVLFNQLVVWPLASLLVIWPQWARNEAPVAEWSWAGLLLGLPGLMLISDQLWYWSHRLMHTRWCWKHLHKMHHIAPQCAISATYVHPWEYTLFTLSMQLPFALAGYPMWVHAIPMGWGMLTGSGAHSGYGGPFANGEKHGTGHHLYHSANFGLLMIADVIWGTHWAPGDPPPRGHVPAEDADAIAASYAKIHGSGIGAPAGGAAEDPVASGHKAKGD